MNDAPKAILLLLPAAFAIAAIVPWFVDVLYTDRNQHLYVSERSLQNPKLPLHAERISFLR
jgi:hypothetical protein